MQRYSGNPQAFEEERFTWTRANGVWLPARITVRDGEFAPGMGSLLTIEFDGWTPAAQQLVEGSPPTGALADELRAVWDAFYRYPTPHARVSGDFRARNPGTDGVWRGRKDVRGTFELEEARDGFWRRSDAKVEGKKLTEDEHSSLQNALLDRILMWSGRDVCRMPRFDDAFRGAELSRDGDWIIAPGALVPAVRIDSGRVTSFRTPFGGEPSFRWTTIDGQLLPSERREGDEVLRMQWKEVADGWFFPTRVDFEAVFGRDWGPEVLELSKLAVRTLE